MDWRERFSRLAENLGGLGARRLAILGLAGVLIAATVAVSGYYLTRPPFEPLYTGLSARDVTEIGAALGEARIRYDVSADGKTVKVAYGQAARARMLLAEKGLPRSARAGYELFDNIGALGLTSFMQEVTLVRALEGELARTIQSVTGIKAARVHLVLPRKTGFRRTGRQPSASVLIRTDGAFSPASAGAIRRLVSGAVPGLSVSHVSVLNTDGTLLASGEDGKSAAPRRLADLETAISRRIRENIQSTLVPYLGTGNFQVSVAARLNMDKRKVSEVIFDPASRVERSVRDIKEKTSASNSSNSGAASVAEEIPGKETNAGPASNNREKRERKERLTNYEINSKHVDTVSDGYQISRLSVAVVINRKSLELTAGKKLTPEELQKQERKIAKLIGTAAGLDRKRGDKLEISAVEFVQSNTPLEPVPGPGIGEYAMSLLPAGINALALLGVTGLVVWFGVRPALRLLTPVSSGEEAEAEAALLEDGSGPQQLPGPDGAAGTAGEGGEGEAPSIIADILPSETAQPLERLLQMIEYDEEQAAAVIRDWLREEPVA